MRLAWIDNLRLFAITSVILGHSLFLIGDETPGHDRFGTFIVSYNMYLFVFLSGYCGYKGLASIHKLKDLNSYLLKTSARVAVPNFCFSFLSAGISNFTDLKISSGIICFAITVIAIGTCIYKGNKYGGWLYRTLLYGCLIHAIFYPFSFWFIRMLVSVMCVLSVVTYIGRRIFITQLQHNVFFPILILLTYAFVAFFGNRHVHADEFMWFYILGILMKKFESRLKIERIGKFLVIAAWATIIIIALYLLSFIDFENDFYRLPIMSAFRTGRMTIVAIRQTDALLWVLLFFYLFKGLATRSFKITYWGGQTLGLYMVHAFLIGYTKKWIEPIRSGDLINWCYPICFAIILLFFSCFIIVLIHKSETMRVMLLGEKK